jgi:multiple sugar transport system ATP-binding protein
VADIVFEHITKRYNDGFEAVKDMNLTIDDGELMVLVGPSGSGKSTAPAHGRRSRGRHPRGAQDRG